MNSIINYILDQPLNGLNFKNMKISKNKASGNYQFKENGNAILKNNKEVGKIDIKSFEKGNVYINFLELQKNSSTSSKEVIAFLFKNKNCKKISAMGTIRTNKFWQRLGAIFTGNGTMTCSEIEITKEDFFKKY